MTHGVENFDFAPTYPVMIIIDVTWLTMGIVWLVKFYMSVHIGEAREIMLGKCAKLYYTRCNKNTSIIEATKQSPILSNYI